MQQSAILLALAGTQVYIYSRDVALDYVVLVTGFAIVFGTQRHSTCVYLILLFSPSLEACAVPSSLHGERHEVRGAPKLIGNQQSIAFNHFSRKIWRNESVMHWPAQQRVYRRHHVYIA